MSNTSFADNVFIGWGIVEEQSYLLSNNYSVRLNFADNDHWNLLDSDVDKFKLSHGAPVCVKVNSADQYASVYDPKVVDFTMQGAVDKLRLARTYAKAADDDGWQAGELIDQVIETLLAQNTQVI